MGICGSSLGPGPEWAKATEVPLAPDEACPGQALRHYGEACPATAWAVPVLRTSLPGALGPALTTDLVPRVSWPQFLCGPSPSLRSGLGWYEVKESKGLKPLAAAERVWASYGQFPPPTPQLCQCTPTPGL